MWLTWAVTTRARKQKTFHLSQGVARRSAAYQTQLRSRRGAGWCQAKCTGTDGRLHTHNTCQHIRRRLKLRGCLCENASLSWHCRCPPHVFTSQKTKNLSFRQDSASACSQSSNGLTGFKSGGVRVRFRVRFQAAKVSIFGGFPVDSPTKN